MTVRYQVFLLDGARVARAYQFECDSLEAAIGSLGPDAGGLSIEIWQGPVRVWTRPARPPQGEPA
jgi:hypothetical protein